MGRVQRTGKVLRSIPTREGAGVLLHRAFGYRHVPALDPFLLLDDFTPEYREGTFIRYRGKG
jgi:redox-sensitive bicupin YhaK (pirin superfamily)